MKNVLLTFLWLFLSFISYSQSIVQNQISNCSYLGDINGDGVDDIITINDRQITVSKADVGLTPILTHTFGATVKRIIIGDFVTSGRERGKKQIAAILNDGTTQAFAISDDLRSLWWWFTQGNFIADNELFTVANFDTDVAEEIMVHNPTTGQIRFFKRAANGLFAQMTNFEIGNLGGTSPAGTNLANVQVLVGAFSSDHPGRKDLLIVDYASRQIRVYGSVILPNGNLTFWWAFTTNGNLFPTNSQICVANINGGTTDGIVIRNGTSNTYSLHKIEYGNGNLVAETSANIGQLPIRTGNCRLVAAKVRDAAFRRERGGTRDDILVLQLDNNQLTRTDARFDGTNFTYWWAFNNTLPNSCTPAVQGPVTLYEHCDFQGNSINLRTGRYPRIPAGLPNDALSSLKINGRFKITLYENENFHGRKVVITSETPCLTSVNFNDIASSMEIEEVVDITTAIFSNYFGTIFEEGIFTGVSNNLKGARYTSGSTQANGPFRFTTASFGVSKVGSIQVTNGFKAIFYQNADYTGTRLEVVGDRESLPFRPGSFEIVPYTPLNGFVDMHTHPMSQFGFGREFFYGNIDGNFIRDCNDMHGYVQKIPGPFPGTWIFPTGSSPSQNLIRNKLIDAQNPHPKRAGDAGWEDGWPKQSYTTHQQMWWEWIDRARRGGLKTIVALAQNSHTLADAMETVGPYDDLHSMEDQIRELIAFVGRHTEIMDTVTTATRMRKVVQSGRLAVIIGIEMDNIGNFYSPAQRRLGEVYNSTPRQLEVKNEIDRLHRMGVRYIFPVHIVNNVFGGAAVYGNGMESISFNASNFYLTGRIFNVESVSTAETGIAFREPDFAGTLSSEIRTLIDVARNLPFAPLPSQVLNFSQYSYPSPDAGFGHRNTLGLTPDLGDFAIRYMMRKGMMIDIDHMSEKCVADVMRIALDNNYPLNSGHNGPRGTAGDEKTRTDDHYTDLRTLGGMAGVGTGDVDPSVFVGTYSAVINKMRGKNVAMGTDVHVGAKLPKAPSGRARLSENVPGLEVCCRTGDNTKRWDFESFNKDGMSHYGLFPEFIQSLRNASPSFENYILFSTVEDFAQMWEKCERQRANIR